MRKLFNNIYAVEARAADVTAFLDRLSRMGVVCEHTRVIDDLTIKFQISGNYMKIVSDLAKRLGVEIIVTGMCGPKQFFFTAKRRAILLVGFSVMIFLTLFIPTRILFVEVEGNTSLSTQYILDQAERIGIRFGAKRKSVRSEKIKNAMLQLVPELKWAGVNTYGCRAVINVTERKLAENRLEQGGGVQGIYAQRDGIVSDITVIKGTPVCKVGQAVNAGQLLVSGYTDCGLHIRAEQAQGRVKAITQHKIRAKVPVYTLRRTNVIAKQEKWSVQFGKKRIKLYNSSGNCAPCCGKIYETFHLLLPGGFRLPVAVVKETLLTYERSTESKTPDDRTMNALVREYLVSNMVDGRILRIETFVSDECGIVSLAGTATCEELIGRILNGEIDKIDS